MSIRSISMESISSAFSDGMFSGLLDDLPAPASRRNSNDSSH
jgi:hypothetical protein